MATDVVTHPFNGVTHIHRSLTTPRRLNINIVVIDLYADGIGFVITPDNGASSGDANPVTTTSFLANSGAQIAINCGFFNMSTYDVLGYVASEGNNYSCFVDYNLWEHWPLPYVSLHLSYWNTPSMIFPAGELPSCLTTPIQQCWNAVPGSEWIVRDGVVVVDNLFAPNPSLAPRTVAGYRENGSELVLATIDGRQTGFSLGMTMTEAAELLVSLGVYQGIAFDGGGSTTLAFADPEPRVVNSPSGGSQRAVPNHLGVYANYSGEAEDYYVFNDFENGYEGTFAFSPGYSGSTQGIDASLSSSKPLQGISWTGQWSEKFIIKDDSLTTNVTENPGGGWFIRWVSGSSASPFQNVFRPLRGYVGFWLKTQTQSLEVSLCIDNDGQMERGLSRAVTPDGYWHCYSWSLDHDSQWQGWIDGDGRLDGNSFTLDSIQIFGPDTDARFYIDAISHNLAGGIDNINSCLQIFKSGDGMAADLNEDCVVDVLDLIILADDWLMQQGGYHFSDFIEMSSKWLQSNYPQ
ncbi:phosphodiester glycosidase family protein [Limihaloglobus sulfuriphilus]|nr:phosphodiester glycosidase family protein [Limihaloglobus sulfuriphilus]